MLITLFVILLLLWILGFGVMHVAGFMIHFLLLAAVIALIVHLVRPRGGTTI